MVYYGVETLTKGDRMKKLTDQELITEMKRVYAEIGKIPTTNTWKLYSKIALDTYRRAFGSWDNALRAAEIIKEEKTYVIKSNMILDLKNAYIANKELGVHDLIRASGHTLPTIMKYFDSVDAFLKVAKIDLNNRVTKEMLIEDFKQVYSLLGEFPTTKELRLHAKHNFSTFIRKFGSIEAVAEAAGIQKEEGPLKISEEELLEELRNIHSQINKTPTLEDVLSYGKYSPKAYDRAFGSFSAALQQIGLTATKQLRVNQICSVCGVSSSSMAAHYSSSHPLELLKQEALVIELFKGGLSSRKIAIRADIIFKGGTSVNRIIRKYLTPEEIETLRVGKITKQLKDDYAAGKYEWVNEINRNRNTTPEAKAKTSEGLKAAYASGERKPWNLGLTKENDARVQHIAVNISSAMKDGFSSGDIERSIGPESSNWNENREEVAGRYRLGLNFNMDERERIKARAGFKCEKCGITQEQLIAFGQILECDHIIPICRGGTDAWEINGQALCEKCHQEKSIAEQKNDEVQQPKSV